MWQIQGAIPEPTIDSEQVKNLATGVTGAIALLVALVGLTLLTVEGRSTDRTLLELGAPPRFHRRLASIRALLLCGLAGALALTIGTLALSAVTRTKSTSSLAEHIALPTRETIIVIFAIPLNAATAAWLPARKGKGQSRP